MWPPPPMSACQASGVPPAYRAQYANGSQSPAPAYGAQVPGYGYGPERRPSVPSVGLPPSATQHIVTYSSSDRQRVPQVSSGIPSGQSLRNDYSSQSAAVTRRNSGGMPSLPSPRGVSSLGMPTLAQTGSGGTGAGMPAMPAMPCYGDVRKPLSAASSSNAATQTGLKWEDMDKLQRAVNDGQAVEALRRQVLDLQEENRRLRTNTGEIAGLREENVHLQKRIADGSSASFGNPDLQQQVNELRKELGVLRDQNAHVNGERDKLKAELVKFQGMSTAGTILEPVVRHVGLTDRRRSSAPSGPFTPQVPIFDQPEFWTHDHLKDVVTELFPKIDSDNSECLDWHSGEVTRFLEEFFKKHDKAPPQLPKVMYSQIYKEVKAHDNRPDIAGLDIEGMCTFAKNVHDLVFNQLAGEVKEQELQRASVLSSGSRSPV